MVLHFHLHVLRPNAEVGVQVQLEVIEMIVKWKMELKLKL